MYQEVRRAAGLVPIEALLSDLRRTIVQAGATQGLERGVMQDPAGLLDLIQTGERQREAAETRLHVPIPRFGITSVTWACNLNCVGCYAKRYERGHEMRPAQIARVLTDARNLGIYLYVIVGGEPLLVPGLLDLLASQDRSLFFLFTNGTLLTAEHVQALAAARNILPVVSVEGSAAHTDGRRGAGVGGRVQRALQLLRSGGVPFGCATMVTHQNVAEVIARSWFDTLWEAGARFYFLIDYVPVEGADDAALRVTPDDLERKQGALAQRYLEARPLLTNFPPDEYACGGCQAAGRGFIHINADGFVEPCPFSHYASQNVLDTPLEQILGSEFFCAVREHVDSVTSPPGACRLAATEAAVRQLAQRHGGYCTQGRTPPRVGGPIPEGPGLARAS